MRWQTYALALFGTVTGCSQVPSYRIVTLPTPDRLLKVGEPIEWRTQADLVRPAGKGAILFLPDCVSCSTSTVSFVGWRAAIRRGYIVVASTSGSDLVSQVVGPRFDPRRLRTKDNTPRIAGTSPNRLLLVEFDAHSRVKVVTSDPKEIDRKLR